MQEHKPEDHNLRSIEGFPSGGRRRRLIAQEHKAEDHNLRSIEGFRQNVTIDRSEAQA